MLTLTRPAPPADTTAPKRLTRAIVKCGEYFRIVAVYGVTPIGARVLAAYERAVGCRNEIGDAELARDAALGRDGFSHGRTKDRCSRAWYVRRALTTWQRESREAAARVERGEVSYLAQRQAS